MTKKSILYTLVLLVCGANFCEVNAQKSSSNQKPPKQKNIIFILADDLGWADLPAYGNRFNESPNIDKLAREGMRFTDAYSAGPVCSPTRASIMSGQYPARLGFVCHIPGHWRPYEQVRTPSNRAQFLPQEIKTVAEQLKDAGYATAYFGKWHLGNNKPYHPVNQGFDVANVGQSFYNTTFIPAREDYRDLRFSDRITEFGVDFIEENKDKPFFLMLAHYDVHVLLDADIDLIDKYLQKKKDKTYPGNAVYAAMIEHLDRSVGRIMAKLKSAGLDENTILVFASDNGGVVSENIYPFAKVQRDEISRHDRWVTLADSKKHMYADSPLRFIGTSNAPLRNEKGSIYEGGIRIPLIVKWPGAVKPGTISEAMVISNDFYSTFMEMAGMKPVNRDGQSMVPTLLDGNHDLNRALYWHYPVFHHDVPSGAIRQGEWKLIENFMTGEKALYNLTYDIGETTNLASDFKSKTKELHQLLQSWQTQVGAEFPVPNPDFNPERRYEWGVHPSVKK
ncbi:sulfatase [Arundinibacter roseus]|nr:sulfatase [Arundinibacter roseus]